MFNSFATLDRISDSATESMPGALTNEMPATYMIYRNGRPFLMVNASRRHVLGLIEGFSSQSKFAWTFDLQQAA